MASLPEPSPPISSRGAWLIALIGALLAAAIVLFALRNPLIAAGFGAAGVCVGAIVLAIANHARRTPAAPTAITDWSIVRTIADASDHAIAVTDRSGTLVCANPRFADLFDSYAAPPELPVDGEGRAALREAVRTAWRDGVAEPVAIEREGRRFQVSLFRAGDHALVWRFVGTAAADLASQFAALVSGPMGDRLGAAGIMVVLIEPNGRIRAANRVFGTRATGSAETSAEGRDFARFLTADSRGLVRFEREGMEGNPLRVVQLPLLEGDNMPMPVAILDDEEPGPTVPASGSAAVGQLRSLIAMLPIAIALIDRDGRFVHMNEGFMRVASINPDAPPLYPSDLVVRDDKAALSDAVRRFANGAAYSTDMAVRLKDRPDDPVAVMLAGARGLGDAAVVLAVRDSGEESTLKRQIAQANKMQGIGQLAGGIAHDFNNILTAIIGHCDLMLMRHTPGDSDYDDIQQIRANSNRAASLTRQLLAFSRQQTLRPQVLQLPDIISEVSNLLKRLLGETVDMVVQHGRNLGLVRADPGQLEQVVVNLAVNARDAMLAKNPQGGGTLTIETMGVPASQVRAMDEDVLPIGDYTALRISDTGTGIPPDVMPKIFEPFFTTKEVGKGTGLGLSTVYGIVKQSGGYIFAESVPGEGSAFTIYLPVHAADTPGKISAAVRGREKAADMWGTETILLVEDDSMVRVVAQRGLGRQGYTVLVAENGEAALELLETCPRPDLLISDVVMPSMDGPTMARHVRERYPDLPILFMSGYAEEQLRRSIDLDNVTFLPKPFSVQQLGEAARDVLRGS
ncbi:MULTISPECIES: hybrid sensor histidine kinase/response regulator [unclassified Sphingomonas]|uniref:hybrid sensor histidine kinase/response regulator n=1 Tax=unclassified Sphingomonas TaxID=196159 RepID=UPI00082F7781|nr:MULTISPECIES: ATP-binding protein [unclassified Sphingomonas]